MSAIAHSYTLNVELNDGILELRGLYPVGLADAGADTFKAMVTQAGVAFGTEDFTVKGFFIRPDGQTVYLTGTALGSGASITLTAPCYALSGPYTLTVKLDDDDTNIATLFIIHGVVIATQTPDVADYGDEYPSLTALLAGLQGKIAEPASDGTAGQVLTTDGNGGRSWQDGPTAASANALTIGNDTYALRTGSTGAAGYITFVTE